MTEPQRAGSGQFVRIVPRPHKCVAPSNKGLGVGTQWLCDCGQLWHVERSSTFDGGFWQRVGVRGRTIDDDADPDLISYDAGEPRRSFWRKQRKEPR